MSLPAAERAKRYREKKNVVRNSDNLYRKAQRRTMKVMDSIKMQNDEKKGAARGASSKTKREEM